MHATYIINKKEEYVTLSTKELSLSIKYEFDLDMNKTKIRKCLKSNGFFYKRSKIKMKMKCLSDNWPLRHMKVTNFHDIFFTDETTFYYL